MNRHNLGNIVANCLKANQYSIEMIQYAIMALCCLSLWGGYHSTVFVISLLQGSHKLLRKQIQALFKYLRSCLVVRYLDSQCLVVGSIPGNDTAWLFLR